MSSYSFRTMVVPAELIGTVRGMAAVLGVPADTWSRDVSAEATPTVPVAVLGSGGILDEFAILLPCTTWQQSDDGAWTAVSVYPGRAADVAAAVGVPAAAVQAVFGAVDVSTQTPETAMARLGMVYTHTGDADA